ncbi:MAG: ATP-binding protein [Sedimentisphaerales bacterium]|nr:ATP-binding protein [Sedimentisphaerales bacterium]
MKEQCQKVRFQVELRIMACPQYLYIARQAVRRMAELSEMSEEERDVLTLAMEEALTNVIRHGYGGPCDKQMIIQLGKIEANGERSAGLEIVISDFGKQVDPGEIKGRDLDDVRPGGLGVHIIKSMMDEVEYTPREEGGMQLRMVKYAK